MSDMSDLIYRKDIMPDEIKPEKKLMKYIYAFDFFAIVFSFAIGEATKQFVATQLQMVYVIGMVIVGIVLSRQSHTNPKKRVWQALQIFVLKSNETYQSIHVADDIIAEEEGHGIF